MLNIPVTDQQKGLQFYENLLGEEFAQSHYKKEVRHHAPATTGVKIDIGPPTNAGQPIMAMFAVRDLASMVARLQGFGGQVMAKDVPISVAADHKQALDPEWKRLYGVNVGDSMGTVTVMKDPFGNGILLVEMQQWAEKAFDSGDLSDRDLGIHDVALKVAAKTFGPRANPPSKDPKWNDD
jgi:predicted enzyme related to lactoylglutathione lyase